MVAYVGEGKIISKASKTDVSFHAQRAMQELSFDTFKSIKSQEIVLPPSLSMILPHDYVNYTCISSIDDAGIKQILYPTNKTSNPFKIKQDDDGNYDFAGASGSGAAGPVKSGIISPRPPPKSGITDSIILPLTFSMIASLRMNTYPTVPTTARDTTPLAIAIPFTIFCNMILIILHRYLVLFDVAMFDHYQNPYMD